MANPSARPHFDKGTRFLAEGNPDTALPFLLEALRLSRTAEDQGRVLYNLAVCYACRHDSENALKALKALEERAPALLPTVRVDPDFRGLHADPSFSHFFPSAPPRPSAPPSPHKQSVGQGEASSALGTAEQAATFRSRFSGWFLLMSILLGLVSLGLKFKFQWGLATWLGRLGLALVFAAAWGVLGALGGFDPPGSRSTDGPSVPPPP